MNLSKIKKPWWVPGWVWNKGISLAAEKAKAEARVDKIAALAGDKAGDLMEKAVEGKDPVKVEKVCANCERASVLFGKMSAALKDCKVSAEERAEISKSLTQIVWGFIDQAEIDAKIDEIAAALRA